MSCLRDGIIRDLSLFSDISVKTYCVDFEKRRPPEAFSPKPGSSGKMGVLQDVTSFSLTLMNS
ncbi:hypothetical protein OUZ56_016044 [Daphnia magna]|uniref:Uncharacterized protein n=1 Tax=Daphnia magna TaxID=35525 RepID=A0ABR0APL4_9CRUS|nr:hypothetical protein OUZ56_016044 [Daphnia magna]